MTSEPEPTTAELEPTEHPSEVLNVASENATILEDQDQDDPFVQNEDVVIADEEPEPYILEDEGEDYTPVGSSADDPEKARNYKEYKRLVKDIDLQNTTIEDIKTHIHMFNCKQCLANSERKELRRLYDCLEKEMQKLRGLMNKAMSLQNFGSRRHYKEINLVTTFDEDQMDPTSMACENMQVHSSKAATTKRDPGLNWRASGGDTTSDMEKSCSYQDSADQWDSEEQQLMKEICAAFQTCSGCKKSSKKKPSHHSKDGDSMGQLKQRVCNMQQSINKINKEICNRNEGNKSKEPCACHKTKHQTSHKSKPPICSPTCKPPKAQEFQKLKDNYMYLLTEFSKKEDELKQITKSLKNSCGSACGSGGGTESGYNADASEIQLLKNRINDLKEEQIEFKCLMKEQSSQLEDYRNKYLNAQQKVEEQCALIEKLNMNNKRIEKQINLEVKEIRCKFQEKLNELLQFPKLLENEQIKVAKLCKDKEDLESKLLVVCKELKTLKNMQSGDGGEVANCKPQLQKCQQELDKTKKCLDDIQRQRDLYCEQLKATQDDLDCLRSESAKIVARLKERSDSTKQQQQEQINRLEKQLAQCRATACLSVSDRECVIREMQGQLNTLSYSFDAAQKQIKTLRNHIAYISNENCFPAKC